MTDIKHWYIIVKEVLKMNFYRDTRATVDLDHLLYNIDVIYKKSQKPLMAVLKANAYGHGDQAVASVLENHLAIAMYGLATIKEAIDLRIAGMKKEMLVIGPTRWEDAKYAAIYNVALTAYSMDYIQSLVKEEFTKPLKLHIKLDTGMNRIGLRTREELEEALHLIKQNKMLKVTGVFTHFGASEEENETYALQLQRFQTMIEGYSFEYVHADNSAGTMYRHDDFTNLDRLGIGMYGVDPKGRENNELKPVMMLSTTVLMVKHIKKGEKVGYGFTYTAENDEYVATLPIGYADGFIRKNQGRDVYINNKNYQIIGRVCMDQMMVRVDETVKVGDRVEIFGPHLSIVQMAKELETIPYEIMCLLTDRVERRYEKIEE